MSTIAPELGLVCISALECIRFRTLTRKRLLTLTESERDAVLRTLYAENIRRLSLALEFCAERGIRLYRLSSALFPFADSDYGTDIFAEFETVLKVVGDRSKELGIRLVLHPEQFVVLNSDRPDVIVNSITILRSHARMFDWMGMPHSAWSLMNIHGGRGGQADRLVETILGLPENIRSRLTLENDEHAYGAEAILAVCQAAGIPMVFDAHHHIVHHRLDSYDHPSVEAMLLAARATWSPSDWQVVHISNGLESFGDSRHSDLITTMPASYRHAPWIEVEAKSKELAIEQLRREWLNAPT